MKKSSIVVIDLGGTKINTGLYREGKIVHYFVQPFNAQASVSESIRFIADCISEVKEQDTCAVAIGVPSIVDIEQGIVFDAVNIRSWQKVALKEQLQSQVGLPVYVNNDVNCFTKGEHTQRKQQGYSDMVGLCLGTGLGSGIVLQNHLYAGANCCAGELGSISYLNSTFDDYCSGQFFINHYQQNGAELAKKASQGDPFAIDAFKAFGTHISAAISHLLLVIDPQIIILGGSVSNSYDLFIESVWESLREFPFQSVVDNLVIEKSGLANGALLGAAQLYLENSAIVKE